MGVRLNVDLAAQIGRENSLSKLSFDGAYQAVLDTLDHATVASFVLDAAESNFVVPFGDVAQARFVWIEADGPIRVTPGGGAATSAQLDGVAGAYPTAFSGGEAMSIDVDGTTVAVTFDAADQTLSQVINRINAAAALAGVAGAGGVPATVARANGANLRLVSPLTGTGSTIEITAIDAAVAAALGLAVSSAEGIDAQPGVTPLSLLLPQSGGAADETVVKSYLVATLVTTALTIDNLDSNRQTTVTVAIAGDLTTVPAC